mgnify:FL=1
MPKEYEDIKANMKKKYPKETDDEISARAAKIFYSIFGITVREAMNLEKQGKWKSYLASHSKKEFDADNMLYKSYFSPADIDLNETSNDVYVSGFVSSPYPDESGDVIDQFDLYNKFLDPYNFMAKKLSYGHGWLKDDQLDLDNALGVLQNIELKEHPKLKVPCVYGTWKLMKTHPYYDKAIYGIKEGAMSGFSIEYKKGKSRDVIIGDVVANYIEDYQLGGVGIVCRPMNTDAFVTGFAIKEFKYNGKEIGDKMEKKEIEVDNVEENVVVKESAENKANDTTINKPIETITHTEKQTEIVDDVAKLKQELSELKKHKAEEDQKAEIERLKKEIDSLKAEKRVLVDTSVQNFVNQDPKELQYQKSMEEISAIQADKKLSTYEKLRKISELELKEQYNK